MNLKFIWAFVFCLAGNGVFAQHFFSTFEELCAFADTKSKTAQSGEIKLTSKNQQTIIAVTHDLDFARNSDRTVEMADGSIISGN
jgi:ABC-type polar amino acid transport system ATPase subunit